MKIGIDIDDTIVNLSNFTLNHIYGVEHLFCDNHEMTDNLQEMMCGNFRFDSMKRYVRTYAKEAWSTVKLKPYVIEVFNRLKEKGHELIIITSRNNDMEPEAENITNNYFKKHKIPHDKIIFGTHDKRQLCIDEKLDMFIDDAVSICDDIVKNTNIRVYLFNSKINEELECSAPRVNDWLELEKIINEH